MQIRMVVLGVALAAGLVTGCSRSEGPDAKVWETCEADAKADASLDTDAARAEDFSSCVGEEGYVCGADEANPADCQKKTGDDSFDVVRNPFVSG